MKVCIVGISGKLGSYMTQHALDRGYEVVGICRERNVAKLEAFKDRISVYPGATNDRDVVRRAVAGCDAVLNVGDPILASNRTRRIDFALFMVDALTNDALIHEAPAIVGCLTPSARAYSATFNNRQHASL